MPDKEPIDWITVNGQHIPIYKGQSKQDAYNKAIAKHNEDKKQKDIARNKEQSDKLNNKGKSDTKYELKSDGDGWHRKPDGTYVLGHPSTSEVLGKSKITARFDGRKKQWVIYNGDEYVGTAKTISEMKEKAKKVTRKSTIKLPSRNQYGENDLAFIRETRRLRDGN